MNIYERALPMTFPHCIVMDSVHVPRLAGLLASADDRHVNGSSFAVTSDLAPRNMKVWLSEASFQRVLADPVFGPSLRRMPCD